MQETIVHQFSPSISSSSSSFNNHHPNFPFILLRHPKPLNFPSATATVTATATDTAISISISLQPPVVVPKSPSGDSQSPIQEILLYLDSLGVDSFYCLNSHPPLISTPLSQIKSTVDFLFSLGLTLHDFRRIFPMCPHLLTSSTSATVIPATTFLLREAGVEASNLGRVIRRRPLLLVRNVERELRPTLYFLQGTIGIENISKWASLLSCSVESKFIPRIEYLQKLGFSYRDTILMLRRFPALFCYSIKENFEPKFDYFVVEMGRELKELVSFPQYFSYSLDNRIKPRHRMCVEKGMCLALPTMLKLSDSQFRERLEVCCNSSGPIASSPFWYNNKQSQYSLLR